MGELCKKAVRIKIQVHSHTHTYKQGHNTSSTECRA